ncbi:MAG: DM13 domain-containing protein [Candidatus Limnocylindria bacterium]
MRAFAAALRRYRWLQAATALAGLAAVWFAWWTISPFFIRPVLVESTRVSTVAVASPSLPAATTGAAMSPVRSAVPEATVAPEPVPRLLARGELQRIDALHAGSGPVIIFELEGQHFLRFEDVSILNGPDLQVYLGKEAGGAYEGDRDLHLGALKAPEGTFSYEIPPGTELAGYRSVVVWCRVFRVVFTYADLEAQ